MAELLVLGADPEIKNKAGHTAEERATKEGKPDAAAILQSWQKPDVGTENMILAEKLGNVALIRALNICGVERNITDEQLEKLLEYNEKLLTAALDGKVNAITSLLSEGAHAACKNEAPTHYEKIIKVWYYVLVRCTERLRGFRPKIREPPSGLPPSACSIH